MLTHQAHSPGRMPQACTTMGALPLVCTLPWVCAALGMRTLRHVTLGLHALGCVQSVCIRHGCVAMNARNSELVHNLWCTQNPWCQLVLSSTQAGAQEGRGFVSLFEHTFGDGDSQRVLVWTLAHGQFSFDTASICAGLFLLFTENLLGGAQSWKRAGDVCACWGCAHALDMRCVHLGSVCSLVCASQCPSTCSSMHTPRCASRLHAWDAHTCRGHAQASRHEMCLSGRHLLLGA